MLNLSFLSKLYFNPFNNFEHLDEDLDDEHELLMNTEYDNELEYNLRFDEFELDYILRY